MCDPAKLAFQFGAQGGQGERLNRAQGAAQAVQYLRQDAGIGVVQCDVDLVQVVAHRGDEQFSHRRRNVDGVDVARWCGGGFVDLGEGLRQNQLAVLQQLSTQGVQVQGLDHPGVHAHGRAALAFIAHGVGCDADHGQVGILLAQCLGQLIAIDNRHVDVGEHQVVRPGRPECQCLLTVERHRDHAAQGFELLLDDRLIDGVVFGYQNPQVQWLAGARWPGAVLRVVTAVRQAHRPGDRANVVGIDLPAISAVVGWVGPARYGVDPGASPRLTGREHVHQQCRVVARTHVAGQRTGVYPQPNEPGAKVPGQFRDGCAHVHRGGGWLEFRTVGECAGRAGQLQLQGETAAQPDCTDHVELAVHQFAEPAADGQAQACAGLAAGVAHLIERVEQMHLLGLGNTQSRIADLPLQLAVFAVLFHDPSPQHHPAAVGELDGIAQQVVEDLANAQRIAAQPVGQVGIDAGIQLQAFGLGVCTVGAECGLDHLQRAEVQIVDGHLSGFDLRHIQHVADQLEQGGR
ncbi:hypothetical protein [Pseudomonas sp. PS01300]|uniref:hypothetical protein n=1 Tax=Pseudomonas sp. PS01300 TaxID=2991436 RepID=UPI00249A8B2A|nr:hypothetical protein [Pseudomonas sp. PS01300]